MNTNATRKIQFRALRDNRGAEDEWVYGTPYFSPELNDWYMFTGNVSWSIQRIIKAETIGQYVYRCDENGIEIYEGDVVKCYSASKKQSMGLMVVDFIDGAFRLVQLGEYLGIYPPQKLQISYPIWRFQKEIVGNIHTTPEFQKPKQIAEW